MTTQLQKLWIFYYIPVHCSSVLFGSLHYYTPRLIILTRKQDVVVVTFFLLLHQWFSTVSLKEAKSRPTILLFYHKSIDTFCFIALTKSVTQILEV